MMLADSRRNKGSVISGTNGVTEIFRSRYIENVIIQYSCISERFRFTFKWNVNGKKYYKRLRIYESHIFELRIKTYIYMYIYTYIYSYILNRLFIALWVYLEPTSWPAPSWLVSSVGGALHRYRRGHGFKSRTGLNFFQALFSLLPK